MRYVAYAMLYVMRTKTFCVFYWLSVYALADVLHDEFVRRSSDEGLDGGRYLRGGIDKTP